MVSDTQELPETGEIVIATVTKISRSDLGGNVRSTRKAKRKDKESVRMHRFPFTAGSGFWLDF